MAAPFYNAFMSPEEWEFLDARRLPWPVPWHELFGRSAPLLVEIGFGNGQFLLDLAARRSDANFVGLEIAQPSLRNAQRKLHARQQRNVLLVHARADQGLWTLFAPQSLSGVYVNFPDPWPKASHQDRRLIDGSFLSLLGSRMHEGATLDIATDDAGYAEAVANYLFSCSDFESRLSDPYVHDDESRLRTKYEAIARAEGRLCYYFKWQRSAAPATSRYPVPRELTMPHVVIEPAPSFEQLAAEFEPVTHAGEWGRVRFIELFRALNYDALLVDTYVDEPAMTQRLGLSIRRRANGSLVVGVLEIGFPRATSGVHLAIHHLAQDLIQRDPQLIIVSSNLAL